MAKMKIIVYSGKSIETQAIQELHPISAVNYVNNMIVEGLKQLTTLQTIKHEIYTNNADLVMSVKYLGELHEIETEFFLDGISHGTNIEPLFEDFNLGFDLVSELYEQKPSSLIVDIETNSNEIIVVDNSDKILDTNVSNLDNNEG